MANSQSNKSGNSRSSDKPKKATNSRTSNANKSEKSDNIERESSYSQSSQVTAIVLGAVGVFLLAIVVIPGESLWTIFHNFAFALFGFCAYVIPLLLIYLCFVYAKKKPRGGAALNIASVAGFVIFLSSIIHIFKTIGDKAKDDSIAEQIKTVWMDAFSGKKADGILGTIFGGLLGKLFGPTGALITLFILFIVALLLLTGITLPVLASYIKKPVKVIGEEAGKRFEESAARREERNEERERRRAEIIAEAEAKKNRKLPEQLEKTPVDENNDKKQNAAFKSGNDIFIKQPGFDESLEAPLAEPEMPKIPLHSLPSSIPSVPGLDGTPETAAAAALHSPLPGEIAAVTATAKVAEKAVEKAVEKTVDKIVTEKIPEPTKKDRKPVIDIVVNEKPSAPPAAPSSAAKEVSAPASKKKYTLPSINLLDAPKVTSAKNAEEEMEIGKNKLIDTLESFKIRATVTEIVRGPSVTRYELMPDAGVRISKITSLADDIALHLAAQSVRIEAPIPGKSAIGIEIPNDAKSMVSMREIIDTDTFRNAGLKSKLAVALGKDITGTVITADLAKMPHLLVAGTTGSGKSVCMNTMIISILYNTTPDDVKILMIDPKQVEFSKYNGIAHLETPVVTDARKAAGALGWAVSEMERRYKLFSENQVRDIKGFNKLADAKDDMERMHHIVIFIDELADLMMVAPKEVEDSICRLAQMARAAGIHLVIATQSPRADIITGLIRANIPSRIALKVQGGMESRIIMDQGGAEKLLGNGDMLFNPVGTSKPLRIQGAFISDEEVEGVVNHIKSCAAAEYNDETMKEIEAKAAANDGKNGDYDDNEGSDLDPVFDQAAETVIQAGEASTTMLQRKLKLGYARAARVMDQLESNGIIGPKDGAKPRLILVSMQDWYERQALSGSKSSSAPKEEQMSFADIQPESRPVITVKEPEEDETEDEYEDVWSDSSMDDDEEEPEEVDAFADIYDDDDEEDDEPEEVSVDIGNEDDDEDDDTDPNEVPFDLDDEVEEEYEEEEFDDDFDDDFTDKPVSIDDIFAQDNESSDYDDYFKD